MNCDEFYSYENEISEEKRKSLGIVYTPLHVVQYINESCLELWKGESPPRVLDPCCGTGIFLYDMARKISSRWNLPLSKVYEKYIFGFDVDEEAITISKGLLPDANLFCESSLFESWDGYDIAVTNPPYIRIQNLDETLRDQIRDTYEFCSGATDIYVAFFEKLIKSKLITGFICPNSWRTNKSASALRNYLGKEGRLSALIDFGSVRLFPAVGTYTSILVNNSNAVDQVEVGTSLSNTQKVPTDELFFGDIVLVDSKRRNNILSMMERPDSVFDFCDIKTGLATLADKVFVVEKLSEERAFTKVRTLGPEKKEYTLESGALRACKKASEISKNQGKEYVVIYPYRDANGRYKEEELRKVFPKVYQYLFERKAALLNRDKGKGNGYEWYEFGRTQGLSIQSDKLLFAPMVKSSMQLKFSGKEEKFISGYCIIPKNGFTLEQIKQIFLSKEVEDWITVFGKNFGNGWYGVSKTVFKNYRIRENK